MDAASLEIVEKLRCRLPGATGCSPGCRGLESGIQTRTFGDQDSARAESATPAEGRWAPTTATINCCVRAQPEEICPARVHAQGIPATTSE